MYKQLLLTGCLLFGILTLFSACSNQEAEKKVEAPPLPTVSVRVEEIKELTAPSRLEEIGRASRRERV